MDVGASPPVPAFDGLWAAAMFFFLGETASRGDDKDAEKVRKGASCSCSASNRSRALVVAVCSEP